MSYIYRGAKVSPDEEQPQPVSPRRLRLLLVDENPTARAVIGRRLSHRHYDVTVVEDGFAAQKTLIIQPSDIILIDMDLQLLPAIGTMEKIRAAHPAGHACIVMIGGASDTPKMIAALAITSSNPLISKCSTHGCGAFMRGPSASTCCRGNMPSWTPASPGGQWNWVKRARRCGNWSWIVRV